ncbi:MAG TPA: pilin [Candidatus Dojkabacteria bacterium]|nr:pilin [Candidatus Dojkabacteria bacterium]
MLESILRFFSTPVFAQEPPRLEVLGEAVDKILGYIFPAGVLIAVIMVIVGGYMWIVSGGDPARKQQAQGTLTWAVIGLVLLFLIYGILKAIIGAIM